MERPPETPRRAAALDNLSARGTIPVERARDIPTLLLRAPNP
ncbi:MAG: hypothetical protein AAGI01_11285 [Myxococcota bacterium]